jgi:hypothetical protein
MQSQPTPLIVRGTVAELHYQALGGSFQETFDVMLMVLEPGYPAFGNAFRKE